MVRVGVGGCGGGGGGWVFFFNDTATTEIYTLSLHDALPISWSKQDRVQILASYDAWSIDYENQIQEACRKAGFYPIFAGDFDIALSFCSKQCSKLSEQILSTFSAALDRKSVV